MATESEKENAIEAPTAEQTYADIWAAASLEIIQSLSADTHWSIAPAAPESGDAVIEVVAFVELSGALSGIQQIKLHRMESRAWAQLLVPPAADAPRTRSSPLDDAERDALADVMRRIITVAAAGLSANGWGEVTAELRHLGPLRRAVEGAAGADTLSFSHPDGNRLGFAMIYDGTLRDQILAHLSPSNAPAGSTPAGLRAPSTSTTRFDMLLDVELDVSLRFGNRHMLLHDIAELSPGSVLELDRQIDDPVELLVGGKIIAWGEVVVVDGNYGLRINRLVHRRERMAAVEAAQ
ncbi:MAG: FliM/FliN family flagellar motor switch protein [Terriglobales bacterium]